MSDIYQQIGRRIMKARINRKMSQGELAERMGYASTATISHFENGHRKINIFALNRIAEILDVSVSDLIGRSRVELARPGQADLKIDHPEPIRESKIYVRLQKFLNEIDETTAEHVEQMAAAYFKQTDIPPSEVELVMEYSHLEVKWYFRRRE